MPVREKLSHGFTIALFFGIACLLLKLASPFAGALIGAITLGISFYPLHLWLKKKLPFRSPSLHALTTNVLVVLFIVVPIFLMAWATLEQSKEWMPLVQSGQKNIAQWRDGKIFESNPNVKDLTGWMKDNFSVRPSIFRDQAAKTADGILDKLALIGAKAAGEFISSLGNLALMILALFFVFRDGPAVYSRFESYLPLRDEQKKECQERGSQMVAGVLRGWLFSAVLQGVAAAIGYLIGGVKGWIFFGCLTVITGLLPMIGTALVWVPLAVNSFMAGSPAQGIFLLAWGILVVSLIDNLFRPYLVGKKSDVPFIVLLFALLGGLQVWGVKGIIIGPVLVAVAPVIFDIYKKRYLRPSIAEGHPVLN